MIQNCKTENKKMTICSSKVELPVREGVVSPIVWSPTTRFRSSLTFISSWAVRSKWPLRILLPVTTVAMDAYRRLSWIARWKTSRSFWKIRTWWDVKYGNIYFITRDNSNPLRLKSRHFSTSTMQFEKKNWNSFNFFPKVYWKFCFKCFVKRFGDIVHFIFYEILQYP